MTQPGFQPLSTVYTRALRLLGLVPAQRQLQTPLTVQPVQIVADVGDVSVPHSNPVFGWTVTVNAVAAEFGTIIMIATSRLLRVRILNQLTGTSPRYELVTRADSAIGTVQQAAFNPSSLGPNVATATAIVEGGVNVAALASTTFSPGIAIFDLRPPILIQKGHALMIGNIAANNAMAIAVIYEEIPNQDDVADTGFPEID